MIVAFSFNAPKGKFNAVWQHFTLDNWMHPFAEAPLVDALWLSLKIALLASLVATVLGTFMAIAIVRYRFRGGGLVNFLVVLPLTAPEIVLGASLLTLFLEPHLVTANHQFQLGFGTILIAHIMFCVSYVALTVKARIRGFDWTLEDAAMDLGATPTRTFFKVTLPLILPGILAAFLLSFALSIDDFIITYFVSGTSTNTFPVQIFGQSRVATPPQINVLASMILFGSIAVLAIGTLDGHAAPAPPRVELTWAHERACTHWIDGKPLGRRAGRAPATCSIPSTGAVARRVALAGPGGDRRRHRRCRTGRGRLGADVARPAGRDPVRVPRAARGAQAGAGRGSSAPSTARS